jgi:hypothetical protein
MLAFPAPIAMNRSQRPGGSPAGPLALPVEMLSQPTETTCGPTCLQAVYRFWEGEEPLEGIIGRTRELQHGGTFAVFLGCDALRRGFEAIIYTYNLNVFDPTWFKGEVDLVDRLERQRAVKTDYRLQQATAGYLEFLGLGGRLRFAVLSTDMVYDLLQRGFPIITGLSSTYLYSAAREFGPDDTPDDIRGLPTGHFVVIAGFDPGRRRILVVDPYPSTPYGPSNNYWLPAERVLGAILLGIVTHDANMLVICPRTLKKSA